MGTPYLCELRLISWNYPPKGWAFCNGQTMAINVNQAIFALLGTTYGGNGVQTFLLPGILDTQAGLKGFTAEAARLCFSRTTIPGFGFDIECLYIAQQHGLSIEQTAVNFRYDDEPTTVRFARDSNRMLKDIWKVKTNAWRGQYAVANQRFSFPAEDHDWADGTHTPAHGTPVAGSDRTYAAAS